MSSDRDELAATLWNLPINVIDWAEVNRMAEGRNDEYTEARDYVLQQADALWSAGWRKKPSREAVERTLSGQGIFHPNSKAFKSLADAILALLEGPTETGEK